MICKLCNNTLRIAKASYSSEVGSTDVYHDMKLVCVNDGCEAYEPNMDEPTKYELIQTKVN